MSLAVRRIIRAAHSGDLGDIIASLPIFKRYGGGEYVLSGHSGTHGPREPMTRQRAEWMLPLLRDQPYIKSAWYEEKTMRHNFVLYFLNFRRAPMRGGLIGWHAEHCRLGLRHIPLDPWLRVQPSGHTKGRVVVNRTARYQNLEFPWKDLVQKYSERLAFIGSDAEYRDFQNKYGLVDRVQVSNALELAMFIAGSDLFIGNQSFCCWVAMALGHPLIQETFNGDSIVPRPNAKFIWDRVKNPDFYRELEEAYSLRC